MGNLENEKRNLLVVMNQFLDHINLEEEQFQGRPRIPLQDIIKSLLIMSYHGWSYRRAESDIRDLCEKGFINSIPRVTTLNKYMLDPNTTNILEKLIQLSALHFIDIEDCIMIDSTWFCQFLKISSSNLTKNKNRSFSLPPLAKTRKLHVIIGKKSHIILAAKCSSGLVHDTNFFKLLLEVVISKGYRIKTLLADAGYISKEHYALCQELGIKAFIDFRRNMTGKHAKSKLFKDQFDLYKNKHEEWHENYRFRILIESIFSAIKRKNKYYIRSRRDVSQDCELLLKCLWYNFTIVAKHYY